MAQNGRGNLVLTRRAGESVLIGADITVTVTEVDRGKARLMISAPVSVRIERVERLPRTHKEDGPCSAG